MQLPSHLNLLNIPELLATSIQLNEDALSRVQANRSFLDEILKEGNTHYGINTGFGSLCDVRVPDEELAQLQYNLVRSHACGTGEEVPQGVVKLMLLLKIHGLSQGKSGVRVQLLNQLISLYNADILPVIYKQGSLGASGDLAPLAHLSLPLFGEGEVIHLGIRKPAAAALRDAGITPVDLGAKEGLALLNGTQFMTAYGCSALQSAERLLQWADCIGALTADAWLAKDDPFYAGLHEARPHLGQQQVAATIRKWLLGSELQNQSKSQVQDPYSIRCIPQVHGASWDVWNTVCKVMETEINSVTDNPIVFHEERRIVSGGNFHGQTLALHLDFLAMALSEIASISERRIYLLVSGQRDLPAFLSPEPGINSGFMIAQYTAASIVSQNKQLCTPASVDSIVSSNGQEDHVSMGANAAVKLAQVVVNVQQVLAVELLLSVQALDMRKPVNSSSSLTQIATAFRKKIPFVAQDQYLHPLLIAARDFINEPCGKYLH